MSLFRKSFNPSSGLLAIPTSWQVKLSRVLICVSIPRAGFWQFRRGGNSGKTTFWLWFQSLERASGNSDVAALETIYKQGKEFQSLERASGNSDPDEAS